MNDTCSLKNLSRELDSQLDALSQAPHCGAGLLKVQRAPWEFRTRLRCVEQLACEVESVHLTFNAEETLPQADVARIADHLVSHLNFLEEELAVIEITDTQAQLRSRQPFESEPRDRVYFEVMVDEHGISLHRYRKSSGQRRELVPTVITRKLLARLGHELLCQLPG